VLVAGAVVVGFVFAGSNDRLAAGIDIAGIPVGGLTPAQAVAKLDSRSRALVNVPVTFVAGDRQFQVRPEELGVEPDWKEAVGEAQAKGGGFAVLRGYRRLDLRFGHVSIEPQVNSYAAAVAYEVGLLATKIDATHVEARLVRHGLHVVAVRGQTGALLDRAAATQEIVQALAGFSRAPVDLPVTNEPPRITVADLASTKQLANRILSAPVDLEHGSSGTVITRQQLARMLQLPNGLGSLQLGGNAADTYFAKLARSDATRARDATFAVDGPHVRIVPAQNGTAIDVPATAAAVLAAAERRADRVAVVSEAVVVPKRSTADARAMGITGVVGSYETFFGGIPNRIHNVELVAHLINGAMVAPGATFSFNGTTGARTAAKGFLVAPVIINGELKTGLGGGVCQVSTTTFNAAFVAGLPITERVNHALYISHYPLGRDATVDYPDTDLRFVNDTPHWLLVRTFVTASSLVVSLYGAPQHRRVVTQTAPLTVVKKQGVKKVVDKSLAPGQVVVIDPGEPAMSTWVRRWVYAPNGKLLYDNTWYSNYVVSPTIEDVGPKPKKTTAKASRQPSAHR
jgi:vancomycin resistance protein YoaR